MNDRLDSLASWRADWNGLRVAILGLDQTAFSVADTLAELGCDVLVVAHDAPDEHARLLPVIGARHDATLLDAAADALADFAPEVVVPGAGLDPSHPLLRAARERGSAVWGDVEVAWRVRDKVTREDGEPADWLFVTADDGAPEAARLAAGMLVAGGVRAAPCGGGVPILDAVRDPAGFDTLVVEVSAAQLAHLAEADGSGVPVPHSAACLRAASDDHARAAQAVVYRHTRVACVYNKSDAMTMRMVEEADVTEGARAIGFDLGTPGPSDLGVVDGILADRAFVENRRTSAAELATVEQLTEAGLADRRAVEGVLAAAALARAVGIEPAAVRQSLAPTAP